MFFKRSFHVPMAEAGEGAGSGGAAGGGDGGAAGAGGAGAAGSAGAAAGAGSGGGQQAAAAGGEAGGNALAGGAAGGAAGVGGAAGAAGAGAAGASPFGAIPEKFQVKREDGTPDLEASWAKVEQHRSHLEKRLGAGDIPPAASTDYKLNFPEALADKFKADELAASPKFQAWRDEMHKAGLSQNQFDQALGSMLSLGLAQREGAAGLDEQGAVAALREGWKTDAEFNTNIRAAYRAAETFGDVKAIMAKYGNDPDVIRILANVGKELAEDTSAGAGASGDKSSEMEIQALASSPAYFNPADPQHAIVKARVTAFYDKKYGTAPKSSGSVSIGQIG